LKEEALDRTVWRSGSGTGYGPVVRQIKNEWMNEWMDIKSKPGTGGLAQAVAHPSVFVRCVVRISACTLAIVKFVAIVRNSSSQMRGQHKSVIYRYPSTSFTIHHSPSPRHPTLYNFSYGQCR
jgi:hypothetical protein